MKSPSSAEKSQKGSSSSTKTLTSSASIIFLLLNLKPSLDSPRFGSTCGTKKSSKKPALSFWKPLDVMILHLSYFYRMHASDFIGIQEVRAILEFVEKSYPDLVKEVTRLVPLQKLTEIFRRLVQEQISIKDLRTILEALSEWAQTEKDTVLLTEYVRSSLKRYISYKYSKDNRSWPFTFSIPRSKTSSAEPSNKPLPVPI